MQVAIPFPGFYETTLDAEHDNHLERWAEELAMQHDKDFESVHDKLFSLVNWQTTQVATARDWTRRLLKELQQIDGSIKFEFVEMVSPREYNMETDKVFVDIEFDTLKHMRSQIDDYVWRNHVRERCTSGPGFWSFYSGDADNEDWMRPLEDWTPAQLAMVIEAYIINHLDEDWQEHMIEDMATNGSFDVVFYDDHATYDRIDEIVGAL